MNRKKRSKILSFLLALMLLLTKVNVSYAVNLNNEEIFNNFVEKMIGKN